MNHEKNSSFYFVWLFTICFLSSALGGTTSTLMSVYLPDVVAELMGDTPKTQIDSISGYINALFIFGWAIGGFLWGLIADRLGRKRSMLMAIAFYGLATVLTGLMHSWEFVSLFRFLSGFGVGGVLVTSFTLLSEVWPQKTKEIYTGILSIAFPVGIFSAGLITALVGSWRSAFFVGVLPMFLATIGIWALRESPSWLEEKERKLIRRNSAVNAFSVLHRADLVKGSLIFGSMLIGLWAIFSWLPTWIHSLPTTTDGRTERGLSMMLLGMGGLSGGFFSGWLAKSFGLKKSMIACFVASSILSFILFGTNRIFSPVIYIEIAVLALFFGISQGILSSYIPRLFPTSVRATATGFCFNIGRVLTASAVLFVGVLVTELGGYGNALLIFSLVFIFGLFTVFFVKPV